MIDKDGNEYDISIFDKDSLDTEETAPVLWWLKFLRKEANNSATLYYFHYWCARPSGNLLEYGRKHKEDCRYRVTIFHSSEEILLEWMASSDCYHKDIASGRFSTILLKFIVDMEAESALFDTETNNRYD